MPKDDPPTLFSFSLPKLCVDEHRQVVYFLCLTYLDSLLFSLMCGCVCPYMSASVKCQWVKIASHGPGAFSAP